MQKLKGLTINQYKRLHSYFSLAPKKCLHIIDDIFPTWKRPGNFETTPQTLWLIATALQITEKKASQLRWDKLAHS